jgi:hypothetical protein
VHYIDRPEWAALYKRLVRTLTGDHDLTFSTRSLAKLAEFLVAEGWSTTSIRT